MKQDLISRIISLIVNKRKAVITLILLITIFFGFGLNKLYFYNKFTSWLDKDDPVASLFIELSDKFSINELIVVIVESKEGVFYADNLQRIADYSEQLQLQSEIFAVNSLSTMVDISSSEQGDLVVRDLLDVSKEMDIAEFSAYILQKELYRQQIISADSKLAMISIFVKGDYDSEKVLKQKIMPLSNQIFKGDFKLYYSGVPATAHFLNIYSLQDLKMLSPLVFALISLILLISFRSKQGLLYPLLTVILAVIWTFGLIGFCNTPLTFVTAIIPVLLIAMGSAYGIHMVNRYQQMNRDNAPLTEEIIRASREIFIPVLLAGATTFIGFLSFLTAGLSLISNFGFFAACGIAFSMIISLTLLPALTALQKNAAPTVSNVRSHTKKNYHRYFENLALFVVKQRIWIFWSCSVLIIFFLAFVPFINREVNFTEYFPKKSLSYLSQKIVEEKFQGALPVIADFQTDNCKSPQMLRLLRLAENYLIGYQHLSKPLSIATLLSELNWQLNGRYAIPDSNSAVSNLWFFIEGRKELEQIMSLDEKETLIFSRFPDPSTNAQRQLQSYLKLLESEIGYGVYGFQLTKLNKTDFHQIRELELASLCKEICWIIRGYLGQEIQPETIRNYLKQFQIESRNLIPEPALIKDILDNYFSSAEFELTITPSLKSKIKDWLQLTLQQQNSGKPTISEQFDTLEINSQLKNENISPKDIRILFDTVSYKVKEKSENQLIDLQAAKIAENFNYREDHFLKRVKSILYDLADNQVLLINPPPALTHLGIMVDLKARISGFPALMMQLDQSLFNSQLQSIGLAYLLTLILMIIIYKNFKLGLIATMPIVFTVSVVYGFLGIFKVSLDYATMLTGAVAIGVGIDYSIHLLYSAISFRKKGFSMEDSLQKAITEKAPAIITNAVSVLAGFTVLLFSSMLILRNFGATMMAAMVLASFAAIFYLPAILLVFYKKIDI